MPPRVFVLVVLATAVISGIATRLALDLETLASPTGDSRDDALDWLGPYDLAPSSVAVRSIELGWAAPARCAWAYRIVIDEDMPAEVAKFYNRQPEHSQSWLILEPHPNPEAGRDDRGRVVTRGQVRIESDDAGVKIHGSKEPSPISLVHDFYSSPVGVGPAAPDAACRNRSWDAIEDALTLGWPWLSGHRVGPGAEWTGARVEGRCNETACLTEDGTAGPRAHARVCATPAWRETLAVVIEVAAEQFAAIVGDWRDRDDLDVIEGGTITHRRALVSVQHGRLAWAEVQVLHRWSRVRRHVLIESIDDCPGSLRAAGWSAPPELVHAAERMKQGPVGDEREAIEDRMR